MVDAIIPIAIVLIALFGISKRCDRDALSLEQSNSVKELHRFYW